MSHANVSPVGNRSAREAVLNAIRQSLQDVPTSEKPEDVTVLRDYCLVDTQPRSHIIELFIDRLVDYKAAVTRVKPAELAAAVATACSQRGVHKLVIPADIPAEWLPAGLSLMREPGLTQDDLEASQGVLTGCKLGIAQTGTIVLDCGATQGRRILTLLPDYHLCVVFESQVVGLVPEGISRITADASGPTRPITFISGPSATSDIELNRVEGVHGPRTLEVLLVEA